MTALSVLLGADLFSVAVSLGMAGVSKREVVHLSAMFAFWHMVMLSIGAAGGAYLGRVIERLGAASDIPLVMAENWAGLFGGVVLTLLGLSMLWECRSGRDDTCMMIPRGGALVLLGISVSCDALAVGLSMGLVLGGWLKLTVVLGVVIFGVSMAGLLLGRRVGGMLMRLAQPVSGAMLMLWGIFMIMRIV